MELVLFGDIHCRRVPQSRALRRFAQKQISAWAFSQWGEDPPRGTNYEVTLEKSVSGQVHCRVLIHSRLGPWVASTWADSPYDAIPKALRELKPQPILIRRQKDESIHDEEHVS